MPVGGAHYKRSARRFRDAFPRDLPALCLLALGGLGTGVANVMVATAAGRGGATHASAMAFLMPTVSLLLGLVVRHEHVAAVSIIGGAVCVVGAYLLSRVKH